MANARRAETVVHLDKARTLKLNFNVMCEAEGLLGHSVLRSEIGASEVRAILWAGLKHQDRSLTPIKVGDLMGECDFTQLMGELGEALNGFFGTEETSEGEVEGAGDSSTGPN
jgi:hypothetical protein